MTLRSLCAVFAGAVLLAGGAFTHAVAAEEVSFQTTDAAAIRADLYPGGESAVVLAHGGRYSRASWRPQAEELVRRGFTVLALDFRGFGESTGPGQDDPLAAPLYLDLLAAVRYLRAQGAKRVAIVGGSLGGMAAGDAMLHMNSGEVDRVVFLGARATLAGGDVSKMEGRKLFIVSRDDFQGSGTLRLPGIQADFERVPEPRSLVVVDGNAHAQAIFETPQGPEVFEAIEKFLAAD
jgi:pimeloyl-ACP methyl ester carboxylesterase